MDFEQWCYSKQIKGNWKEALYHSLAEKYDDLDATGESEWATEWSAVLDHVAKSLPSIKGNVLR